MKIKLSGVLAGVEAKIIDDLKRAFTNSPEVEIEDTSTGGTLNATVIGGPQPGPDRQTVESAIDAVSMRNGYTFCNIHHAMEKPAAEIETIGGWPSL